MNVLDKYLPRILTALLFVTVNTAVGQEMQQGKLQIGLEQRLKDWCPKDLAGLLLEHSLKKRLLILTAVEDIPTFKAFAALSNADRVAPDTQVKKRISVVLLVGKGFPSDFFQQGTLTFQGTSNDDNEVSLLTIKSVRLPNTMTVPLAIVSTSSGEAVFNLTCPEPGVPLWKAVSVGEAKVSGTFLEE